MYALCEHTLVNVISKAGLMDLIAGKSRDVQTAVLAWYRTARRTTWDSFGSVRRQFPDADYVSGLLVFNIRRNRYRLIVFPVFARRKLYVKALLSHKEYDREDRETKWP
jgi:mRNA interferase HigB